MKTMQKISMFTLMVLFLISSVSCRNPDDEYNYEDNNEPSTGLTPSIEKAIKLATLEPYADNERLIITKV